MKYVSGWVALRLPLMFAYLLVGMALHLPLVFIVDTVFRAAESQAWCLDCPAIHLVSGPLGSSEAFITAGYALLASPILEEYVFRHLAYGQLRARTSASVSIVVCALGFALIHPSIAAFSQSFVAGLSLGWLRERSGTVAAPMAVHAGFNGAVLFLQWSGPLTAFGFPQRAFEAPLLWVAASSSVGLMLLFLIRACASSPAQTRMATHGRQAET